METSSLRTRAQSRLQVTVSHAFVVARKEFTHAIRSRSLQILLIALIVGTAIVFRAVDGGAESSATAAIEILGLPLQLIVPIAAILAGGSSVSGERESGSLRLLLGMPVSRSEVVLGKFAGVFGALCAGIGVVFVSAVLLSFVTFGSIPLSELTGLCIASILLAGAFLGFSAGVSAAVSTRKRSIAVTIGGLFIFTFLWEPIVAGTYYAVQGTLPSETIPTWLVFLERLNPVNAFAVVAGALGAGVVYPLRVTFGLLGYGAETILTGPGNGTASGLVSDPLVLIILVGWVVVPIGIGLLRFRAVDLT